MAISFPTFTDTEIVFAEKLNNFVQALEAKFTAGLGTTEIQWPLLAGGDLIMGQNDIDGGLSFWNLHNGEEYDTFAAAAAAAAAGTGGCVFIPPGATVDIGDEVLTASKISIVGAGPSSVLRLKATAASFMIQNNTVPGPVSLVNLTLDGNSVAGVRGLWLAGAGDVLISHCWFKNFNEEAILMSGVAGTGCNNVQIVGCHFTDCAAECIKGWDVGGLVISGNVFENTIGTAVDLQAVSATAEMRDIVVGDNVFRGGAGSAIIVAGGAAAYDPLHSNITISDNSIDGISATGTQIYAGNATGYIQEFSVTGNVVKDAPGDALSVSGQDGIVSGNVLNGAADDAIDLTTSQRVSVLSNALRDAGIDGISANNSTDCTVACNDTAGATVDAVDVGGTNLVAFGNPESVGSVPGTALYSTAASATIPAYTLRAGDVLHIRRDVSFSNSANASMTLYLDGKNIGQTGTNDTNGIRQILSTVVITNSSGDGFYTSNGFTVGNYYPSTVAGTFSGLSLGADMDITTANAGLTSTAWNTIVTISSGQEIT